MKKQIRKIFSDANFRASEDEEKGPIAEGTFVVFNTPTSLYDGYFEQITPEAVNLERDMALHDIAALANHNDSLPLARVSNKTLELWKDEKGLHGRIHFNPNDSEAMNWFERIKAGTVHQNSFGFYVKDSKKTRNEDSSITETITDLELIEVSPVTFPAYPDTQILARKRAVDEFNENDVKSKRSKLLQKLEEVLSK